MFRPVTRRICLGDMYSTNYPQRRFHKNTFIFSTHFFSVLSFADSESACIPKYDLLQDSTDAIFYYEISKYDQVSQSFKTLKQWYCNEVSVSKEVPQLLEESCTIINIDGVAIQPNNTGSLDVSFGCG